MWQDNSLEPVDWSEMKEYGKRMLDDLFQYIEEIDTQKTWWPLSPKDAKLYEETLPKNGQPITDVYQEFLDAILKKNAPMNIHPGFLGWAMGCGNPVGVLAEMLAAGMDANVIGGVQATCKIEAEVINWLKELFGLEQSASGLLTSGCSQANLLALIIARNQSGEIRKRGVEEKQGKMVVYASQERHHSIDKAIEIIGIGSEQLHLVPVNDKFEMDVQALEEMIQEDLNNGFYPIAVVANLGTVNTGAMDAIGDIAKVTEKYDLWLHADGAFGAMALITDQFKEQHDQIERVDSIAFDLHKWMYMPYGVGCVLVKDRQKHFEAFASSSAYMEHQDVWFSDYGLELSRDFKALKVWMCLKAYGIDLYKKLIENDLKKAAYLSSLIKEKEELELLAPVSLNVLCFQYKGKQTDLQKINEMNKRILMILQFDGKTFPSETVLNGNYAIRVCIMNYKCKESHLEYLVNRVAELGKKME